MRDDLKEQLRLAIGQGEFRPGVRLPGFRELAERYSCSRGTVENAVRSLTAEGVLRTIQGKGTFLADDPAAGRGHFSRRIVGAVLLRHSWFEAMEKLKSEFLHSGWFVSVYCSSADLQSPAAEKKFLEQALRERFSGVMLVGTPLTPLNTGYYHTLRRAGMKVLHLTHYKMDMAGENAILPDYRMAGALACSAAAARGIRRLFLLKPAMASLPPSACLRESGLHSLAAALGLSCREFPVNPVLEGGDIPAFQQLGRELAGGDPAAVLADSCELLCSFREWWSDRGLGSSPFLLGLSGTSPAAERISHLDFDYEESIRQAMDYMRDERIAPSKPFLRMLEPKIFIRP